MQKLPALLDDVHGLIADHGNRYRFALSGSSSRKLRRLDVNLLAGRAINRTFFPLSIAELGEPIEVDDLLRFGMLPGVRVDPGYRVDVLDAYVANYVREEIQQEALVKQLDSFARFLEVAASVNGQIVNVAGIARDAAVARPTVQRYFDVLVDTLIGIWLPAWRPRAKVKELAHPKFYFFDAGVVRALQQRTRDPIGDMERGTLLETHVLHELRAWMSTGNVGGTLSYWRTPSGSEIDFVWTRGPACVGIEVKASRTWRNEHGSVLLERLAEGAIQRGVGVYLGDRVLKHKSVDVLPLHAFVEKLHTGHLLRG